MLISRKVLGRIGREFKLLNCKIMYTKREFQFGENLTMRKRFNPNVNGGKLVIGDNVFFNNDCSINCQGEIIIGDNSLFGEGVKIYDHNHEFSELDKPVTEQGMRIGKVSIGDDCWIGSNVVILANVEIGDRVIIGANCTIYKSIPNDSLVKSNPNLLIEQRKNKERKIV